MLEAAPSQRCDVTALLVQVSAERHFVTSNGPRIIVDVAIRDASGWTGASQCAFTMFFEDSQQGRAKLEEFKKCQSAGVPIAFFNLCIYNTDGKNTLKPAFENFRWKPARKGPRAEELAASVDKLQNAADAIQITTIAAYSYDGDNSPIDYKDPEATLTVTRLLREVIRSQENSQAMTASTSFN